MNKKTAFFIIKGVLLSILAFGAVFFLLPLVCQSEFYLFKLLSFYAVVVLGGLFWAIALYHRLLSRMASDVLQKYDNIEQLLLDVRDGTKSYFKEKRRSVRVKTDMPARFSDDEAGKDAVSICNIGYDGALIRTTRALKAGEPIRLSIYLPLFSKSISARARVIHAQVTGEMSGSAALYNAGIQFTGIHDEERGKLIESINILNRTPRRK